MPWVEFRRAKGGVKAHDILGYDGYFPSCALISQAKLHNSNVLEMGKLQPRPIVAMDREYNDCEQFFCWTEDGIFFVTRMKDNTVYEVVQDLPVPQFRNILSDEVIRLTGLQAQKKCPCLLWRIVVLDR